MRLLNKKAMAGLFAVAVAVTLIALPSIGSDSEHQDLRLVDLEVKILNDNVAVKRAELAYELAPDEQDEADDNKGSSGSSIIETRKKLKYYPKKTDMNVYIAEQDLNDVKQAEILNGTQMYYEYLLLVKEIGIKNDQILRLQKELTGVEKKIELGTATVNAKTAKSLEIADAEYELMLLQDEKESLFLDLNLALQQDLMTVLVIEDVAVPFNEPREVGFESDLE